MGKSHIIDTIDNYIIVDKGLVSDHNCSDNIKVSFRQGYLNLKVFSSEKLQVIFVGDQSSTLDYKIDLKSEVVLDLVEMYLHTGGEHHMTKQYLLHHLSKLHKVVLNDTASSLVIDERINAHNGAICETVFAELSDGNTKATYTCDLVGEFAMAKSLLAAISTNTQKKEYNVTINHLARNTSGQIENFGVNKDQGHLIFNGTGFIAKDAKQSKSHQNSKILVFDKKCVSKVNPYLIIDENDVEASHAAAVGQMDEEQLFYMRSRGLSTEHASQLITYGYLMPVANEIENEGLNILFKQLIEKKVG